jgi:hypothetical protein
VFTTYVGDLIDTDLLVLDLETGDQLSQAEVNAWAKAWAARITEQTGRRPVLYCGHAYMENNTGIGLNGPFSAWWYPRYPSAYADTATWPTTWPTEVSPTLPSPNAWGDPPDLWQFSQSFPTGQGPMDANLYNGTVDQLKELNMATPTDHYNDVWRQDVMQPPSGFATDENPTWTAESVLRTAANRAERARIAAEANAAELTAVKAELDSLTVAVGNLAQVVADLARAALAPRTLQPPAV